MKKLLALLMALVMALGLAACGAAPAGDGGDTAETPETMTIESFDENGEAIDLEVPYDPQRIVVIDMAVLDILTSLGLEDRIVGVASTSLDYLTEYVEGVPVVGTIKTPDLEGIMECEPDIIFMGGRGAEYYSTLSEIAPTVRIVTDSNLGLVESVTVHSKTIASIFGLEDEIDAKVAGFQERIDTLREFAQGKTMILGMCTSGSFNFLGNDGRCSIIGTEIGFENIGIAATASDDSSDGSESGGGHGGGGGGDRSGSEGGNRGGATTTTATHGNEASFELVLDLNPQYIFVMDRDAAIGTDGAQLAKDVMENELVMGTDAYKNGNLIILEHPAVWYTGEGGITALDIMLQDLESALLG